MKRAFSALALLATLLLAGCNGTSSEDISGSLSADISTSSESVSETSNEPLHEVPTSDTTPAADYVGAGADAYYASIADVNILSGSNLAAALRAKGRAVFHGLTYTEAIEPIAIMDEDQNDVGNVIGVYSRNRIPTARRQTNPFTQRENYWNREHCYPQSKLKDGDESLGADAHKANISSDIANLFAEDVVVNETRSNNSFGDLDTSVEKFFIVDSLGKTTDTYSWMGYVEPTDIAKGEVARANLYMILMYPENCALTENGPIETFLEWNLAFPPNVERDVLRNQTIFEYQHNRNPFIDDPDFGCRIWGDTNALTRQVCGL